MAQLDLLGALGGGRSPCLAGRGTANAGASYGSPASALLQNQKEGCVHWDLRPTTQSVTHMMSAVPLVSSPPSQRETLFCLICRWESQVKQERTMNLQLCGPENLSLPENKLRISSSPVQASFLVRRHQLVPWLLEASSCVLWGLTSWELACY